MARDQPRPPVVGDPSGPSYPFPIKLSGPVVKGFGRGSKELGIPTANIPLTGLSVGGHEDVESGIYYGWAGLDVSSDGERTSESVQTGPGIRGTVWPMVMSIGWNPFYKNSVRSVEVHILHKFNKDFYGVRMNLLILGFVRPEYDYVSKESLVEDIRTDIEVTRRSLEREAYTKAKDTSYLLDFRDSAHENHTGM
ncbi:MAG: hypothetical protein LQ351_000857 [Letrouitia transgressa]|nr:MAG: hypothetical protein LQ351_000857 [Letrouitia transgressa]